MSIVNRVEMKLKELSDPFINGVTFSKSITLKDKNGFWWIFGRVYHHSNPKGYEYIQKSTKKESTENNEKYIKNNLTQKLWDVSNTKKRMEEKIINENKEDDIPYFGEYAKEIISVKRSNVAIETHKSYISKYNKYIHNYFKDFKLDKIKPIDIEKWELSIYETYKIQTKNIRSVLNIILKKAVINGIIKINPMDNIETLKIEKSVDEKDDYKSFNNSEMDLILSNVDNHIKLAKSKPSKMIRTQLKSIIYLMYGSGIRSGELLALEWGDIDFKNKTISISKNNRDGRIKVPKTKSSMRKIQMTKESEYGLKLQYENTKHKKPKNVIINQYGNMYNDTHSISAKQWKPLLELCELPYRRIYNLRHTFATTMLQNGLDIVSVSKILGHNDIKVTFDRYVDGTNSVKNIVDMSVRNSTFIKDDTVNFQYKL